ncbi:hypothetical protein Vadar_004299 [Vaccinium darrowii]|uniref:Uncharacterized protein n=1 Tax=Vaccinium darrowii TaxID=229202 RepID=A0ACB7YTY2_9ERIC|nr:hypothetical protein Vadar_004299 [Vaccinium darrowii]
MRQKTSSPKNTVEELMAVHPVKFIDVGKKPLAPSLLIGSAFRDGATRKAISPVKFAIRSIHQITLFHCQETILRLKPLTSAQTIVSGYLDFGVEVSVSSPWTYVED